MADASAREQYLLELINRARLDPSGEAARYGIDLNQGLAAGTISAAPKQVLAFNGALNQSADNHSTWMLDTDKFSHTGIGNSTPGDRMEDAGYVFSGSWTWGENIAWNGTSGTINGDASAASHHEMLFKSAGHRANILNGDFREIGIGSLTGVFTSGGSNWNALMTTENFAKSGSNVFVTGVVYDDRDHDDFYSIGEGQGGQAVQLMQNGAVLASATSAAAGGYSLATTVTGKVDVDFSGQGVAVTLKGANLKVDLVDGNTILSNASATLTGAAENLTLIGIEDVNGKGNALDNVLTGNAGVNRLTGGGGGDDLQGGAGNDRLSGSAGDDRLEGGGGNDRMKGGNGIDTFVFGSIADAANGGDVISRFVQGQDVIDLSIIDAIDGGGNNAFSLLANEGRAFTAAGQVHYLHGDGVTVVEADTDGDGAAELSFTLKGIFDLTTADFLL